MNKKIQLFIAAIIIVIAIIAFYFITIHNRGNSLEVNPVRTDATTYIAPDNEYTDPEELHLLFEQMSGFELDEIEANKKMIAYIYKFTNQDKNQTEDVFRDFCDKLELNGYKKISETIDGSGYMNQYELLYKNYHLMIFTESSPNKVVLSIVDYNKEV